MYKCSDCPAKQENFGVAFGDAFAGTQLGRRSVGFQRMIVMRS